MPGAVALVTEGKVSLYLCLQDHHFPRNAASLPGTASLLHSPFRAGLGKAFFPTAGSKDFCLW